MAKRKVIWTETAAKQRRSILEYWLQRNKSSTYPSKLLRLSNEKAELVAENPLLFKQSEFADVRVATMGHFSLFYKVTPDTIVVMAFWDNRQDPKKLLNLLKAQRSNKM
ncbi:MAG: type II toxin-antitoxin system RelE/ParE family toxin [Cyclobacteriaceae bacterium]